ncbi:PRD domain-containing protein [Vagococcus xieshaowenii]|uniref:PRD domain-containing protein n=1 Tax=Vagococcus xieshaowenii TaxID=2562451 RepID=A0A4Z0D1X1_9ENTE|nr:PRD domain-containing protein [Vagococcus xieshaowenii]QCA29399.1 PRD domain-containing protein [Vagococcus xieshaowenii]TFZ39308.1 PRD domain-containing protein [Vagococcus xieshaowenii]
MELSYEDKKIIEKNNNHAELYPLLEMVEEWLSVHGINQTDIQRTVMINHLNEMVNRSKKSEKIQAVDKELFNEVSEEAMAISKCLVDTVGNLEEDEQYVLSIHFETAKNN